MISTFYNFAIVKFHNGDTYTGGQWRLRSESTTIAIPINKKPRQSLPGLGVSQ